MVGKFSQIWDVNVAIMLLNYRSNTVHGSEPKITSRTSFPKKSDFRFLRAVVPPRPVGAGRSFSARQNPADFGEQTLKIVKI